LAASERPLVGASGWAQFEFTRIDIEPIILRKKIEDLINVKGIGEKSFLKLKLKPLLIVTDKAVEGEKGPNLLAHLPPQ
jgi:hypothetical protein